MSLFTTNSESCDINRGCPGLCLAAAVVTAETVTNVRTQTCDHIHSGHIKKSKNSYPQRERGGGSPKTVGKAEAAKASKVKIQLGVLKL